MKNNVAMELQYALMSTALVQPVDVKARGGRVEVLCRLVPGQEKPWLSVMDKILAIPLPGETHLCRRYMRKDGRMVFGYCLILDMGPARLLKSAVEKVIEVLKEAKPVLAPVDERPAPVADRTSSPVVVRQEPQQKVEIRVVKREVDEEGNEIIEEVMPLPHVRGEMNRPSRKGGRGATRTASSTR